MNFKLNNIFMILIRTGYLYTSFLLLSNCLVLASSEGYGTIYLILLLISLFFGGIISFILAFLPEGLFISSKKPIIITTVVIVAIGLASSESNYTFSKLLLYLIIFLLFNLMVVNRKK